MASGFTKLGDREVWRGTMLRAVAARFRAPDGHEFEREIILHPGAVSVVPVVEEGTAALLVRQFRAAVNRDLLEVPAGKRDVDGEPPEETARRELVEEIGMRAGRLELLGEFYNSPGFCDEHSYSYLGLDLEPCPTDLQGPEEQHMVVERVVLDDVPRLIAEGRIVDAKTIIGLVLAIERLRS